MTKRLSAAQLELIKRDMMKEVEFVEGKLVSYNRTVHQIIVNMAYLRATNKAIAKKLGISIQQLSKWRSRYPDLSKEMDEARANLIEDAHIELLRGKHYTERRKNYTYIKDKETGKTKRVLTGETEEQRYLSPSTKSIDRLAQKYAPDLADKERKGIDANVTFIIDTGIGNDSPVTVETSAREMSEVEEDDTEDNALDFL